MHAQIAVLLELQDIDQRLVELHEQLNRYPRTWEEMKARVVKKTAAYEEAVADRTNRAAERKRIEQDLRLSSDKLKQYQTQQMMVKTAKELTAIGNQIDNLKKTMARLEERGEEILSTEKTVGEKIASAEAELKDIKERARAERDRIRDQVAAKKNEIAQLEGSRGRVLARVDQGLMAIYERTRKRWPSNAVVSVRGGSCTGCNYALLPDSLVKLHAEQDIVSCDTCNRILSHDETFVPAGQQA